MVKAILFDLGNVLVRLNGLPFQADWCDGDAQARFKQFMALSELHEYHCGRMSEQQFASTVIDKLSLSVAPSDFIQHFRVWPDQMLDNALEIVHQVKPNVKTAVFSNINDSHWPGVMNMGLAGKFDYYFASHKVDAAKPEPRIYWRALRDMGLPAEQVLLVDDTLANIEAAKALGLQAEQVVGTQALESVLRQYQLLR